MEQEEQRSRSGSFGRTALAVLVLLVGAWLLLGVIGHVLSFLFSTLLLVVAVVGVIWALKILL
jgi:membrane protein required for beta-lactamase induction